MTVRRPTVSEKFPDIPSIPYKCIASLPLTWRSSLAVNLFTRHPRNGLLYAKQIVGLSPPASRSNGGSGLRFDVAGHPLHAQVGFQRRLSIHHRRHLNTLHRREDTEF